MDPPNMKTMERKMPLFQNKNGALTNLSVPFVVLGVLIGLRFSLRSKRRRCEVVASCKLNPLIDAQMFGRLSLR